MVSPHRRRQRSIRITVATGLVAGATVIVLLGIITWSPLWLSVSSVVALVAGAASTRIVYAELVQSRRDAARDRAAQASGYRAVSSRIADEHHDFTAAMSGRLAERDAAVRALEATTLLAQTRATALETRLVGESHRADEAAAVVAELREALAVHTAEDSDELASWNTAFTA